METETAFRFRVDPHTRQLLDRLRDERHINTSSWAREHIRKALQVEFPDEFPQETPAETPEPQTPEPKQPIAGWKPRKVDGKEGGGKEVWGAALTGPKVAQLPKELQGIEIVVTAASTGDSWTTSITEVVSRSEDLVVVRHTGRPKGR